MPLLYNGGDNRVVGRRRGEGQTAGSRDEGTVVGPRRTGGRT